MIRKSMIAIVATAISLTTVHDATAGPLLDWLLGRRCARWNRQCSNPPAGCCAANAPQMGTCQTTCTQTCQRVVVNYVPYTAYRTDWEQVPVTQYRQTSSTDPCTGCTVTCNRPCTTYTWQMKRVPYTTYRPVYRTEAYSVPITYSTPAPTCSACNTAGIVGGCPSCSVPTTAVSQMPAGYNPSYASVLDPSGTYTTMPSSGSEIYSGTPVIGGAGSNDQTTPADQRPSLKPIILDRREITPDSSSYRLNSRQPSSNTGLQGLRPIQDPHPADRWENTQPVERTLDDQTAAAPTRQRWDYSPIRLASYQTEVGPADSPQRSVSGTRVIYGNTVVSEKFESSPVNSHWKSSQW